MSVVKGPDNKQLLSQMVGQYEKDLLRICYVYLCDVSLADDAVQETFLKAFKHLSSLRGENGAMIATHPHEDHVGGLAGALNACSVDVLYTPVLDYDTKAFQSMMKYAREQNTEIIVPQPGNTFSVGSASVEILAPLKKYKDYNDLSIVVRIT